MILPASTNSSYHGAPSAAWFTIILGLAWIGPGLIHSFLPDGGAGVIAGIGLSRSRDLIVGMFAWAGATQLAHGILLLLIGWRYRPLVPLALAVSLLERSLLALSGWVRHAPAHGHHPPEHYGSLIAVPFILLFLILSLRPTSSN